MNENSKAKDESVQSAIEHFEVKCSQAEGTSMDTADTTPIPNEAMSGGAQVIDGTEESTKTKRKRNRRRKKKDSQSQIDQDESTESHRDENITQDIDEPIIEKFAANGNPKG